ncbi:subtilisin-like protein [Lactarius akahatsu]|uniref:tripeptidyl-peptidase II n=1 Tax=Lactarius akahatsu TaxID=416441 RepID=A0AAD4Q9W0_9AGAM|nr:subtilisin-like protein [Lactarius akahatsu]
MHCHQLSVISVLAVVPFANIAKPLIPSWDDLLVKHTWSAVPPNWQSLGHPSAGTTIDLHFALKPYHENALIDALYEVSDPKSPKHVLSNTSPHMMMIYGAHLSREQVAQLVAPHTETLELVNSWLEYHGVPSSTISLTHGGSWLTLTGVPVSKANEMLGASYQLYRPTGTNDTIILRTVGYALPAVLHTHVQTVVPTTYFASMRTRPQTPRRRPLEATRDMASRTVLRSRDGHEVMPSELRSLYRTATYVPAATDKNVLAVAGFMGDYASPADLTAFMKQCRTDAIDPTFRVVQVNGGGNDPDKPGSEANQNVQYAQAMAYPTPLIFYSTGGEMKLDLGTNEPATGDEWLEWLKFVLHQEVVPQTISISYGFIEKGVPLQYAKKLCDLFSELGARGVSVIVASGNGGVGQGENCIAKDGSGKVQFSPDFPASCPYVTSVGGTTDNPEVAAELSGGGFSIHFPRPKYQNYDVPVFLEKLGSQYTGLYNAAGRGIPDLAAQALNIRIIEGNEAFVADGTSCAVPTVAAIISLLNDYLLSMGRGPLGFLNPWLYGLGPSSFNDITSGSNPGCGTDGFSAVAGWDPVTGLGTPDFLRLQALVPWTNRPTKSTTLSGGPP